MEKSRILVVEDNKIISLEIKQRLESMGYEVAAVAHNGPDAIMRATEKVPDLVLMDIKLNGKMDGIEAAEKIRVLLDIPIVYLTAYSDEATLLRAKVTEPFGYIVKPLEERELHSTIEISLYKHKMEKQLKESESKYHAIVEAFDGYIYIEDPEHKIRFLNNNMIKKLGKNAIGELCYQAIHGLNTPCEECPMDNVMRGKTVRKERQHREDKRWYDEVHTTIHDMNGNPLKQTMMRDITDKKINEEKIVNSLKEKEVMLSEIHHRVKNNLQIISSLLRIESKNITDKEALNIISVSQNRVNSMALIHEKLYSSRNLSHVDFEDYLTHLTSHLLQVYNKKDVKIDVSINAPKIYLGVDTAIPAGLIINELVSNSLKHAFKERQKGKIDISIVEPEKNEYLLNVKDDGIGISGDTGGTNSLGLQLVQMLTKQLSGEICIKNNHGTEISVKFKESKYKERVDEKLYM